MIRTFLATPRIASRAPSRRFYSMDPHIIVSSLTESLQAVHVYSGLPWWALIPVATFTLRTVWTLPLAVLQRKRIQKQNELKPIVSATNPILKMNLAKKVQQAKRKAEVVGKTIESKTGTERTEGYLTMQSPLVGMKYEEILVLAAKETRKRQKKLFKEHDVQIWKNFMLPAFQVPLWVAMSLTMRDLSGWSSWDKMANKPLDPSLYTEGLFWFQDLTVLDPFHVFPLALGITALCNVEWTFKTLELLRLTQRKKLRPTLTDAFSNLSRMMVVFLMAVSLHAPSALTLYWLSSQVFSLVQNVILDLALPISFTPNRRLNYRAASKGEDVVNVINKESK